MKIHVLGIVVLSFWIVLSTHIWVCNVKGLCDDKMTNRPDSQEYKNATIGDSIKMSPGIAKKVTQGELMIYFEFDKSDFRADSSTQRCFTESKTWLDNNSAALLTITGYTDAIGSDEYNKALGYRRAQTILYYFNKNGLGSTKIIIDSKGENEPADNNNTVAGRANNRRALIKIKN